MSRDVGLKLDEGTLAFSIDKRIVDKTRFEVQTPHGRKSVQGAVGTVTVEGSCVKFTSLNGKMNVTAIGFAAGIQIKAGSFLAICGEGANAQIRLINAIARTWTDYSADGSPLGTRDATATELESTRAFFSAALSEASLAEGAGLLGPASAAEITRVLTMINQSFAGAGLAAIESSSVGALPAAGHLRLRRRHGVRWLRGRFVQSRQYHQGPGPLNHSGESGQHLGRRQFARALSSLHQLFAVKTLPFESATGRSWRSPWRRRPTAGACSTSPAPLSSGPRRNRRQPKPR